MNNHCVRCDDQLLNDPKFGINVFAITLSIVIFLSAASVYASKSYFNKKTEDSRSNTQAQNVEPKREEVKAGVSSESAKEEVKSKQIETPVNKERVVTPRVTPSPAVTPICDEDQKRLFTSKFGVGYNEARSELLSKMMPDNTAAEDQAAMDENIIKVDYLYQQYLQDMKSINCTAKPLVGGLISS